MRPASHFMKSVLAARRRVASTAALCVLPNAERGRVFREHAGAAQVTTVWNTPLRSEIANRPEQPADGRLCLWYHGSITPPNIPMAVVEALAQLPECVTLDVVGYQTRGYDGYADRLCDTAASLGIADRVTSVRRDAEGGIAGGSRGSTCRSGLAARRLRSHQRARDGRRIQQAVRLHGRGLGAAGAGRVRVAEHVRGRRLRPRLRPGIRRQHCGSRSKAVCPNPRCS